MPSPSFEGYGYFWWLIGRTNADIPTDTYAARGVDGQFIYVIPSLDLVVVRNGHYDKHDGDSLADPNLVSVYPPSGLGQGKGTVPPDSWSDTEFIGPIVRAIAAR
jgi:CubicO group peptidase (beta-lactamase class C family)